MKITQLIANTHSPSQEQSKTLDRHGRFELGSSIAMTKVAVQRNSSQFIKINGDFDGKPASQPLAPGAPPVKPLIVSDFFIDNNGFSIEKPLIMSGFGRRLGGCRGCRSGFVSHFARDKAGKEIKLGLFGISPLYI